MMASLEKLLLVQRIKHSGDQRLEVDTLIQTHSIFKEALGYPNLGLRQAATKL